MMLAMFVSLTMIIALERYRKSFLSTDKELQVMFTYGVSVFFHELMHYLVSLLTNGKPINFTIVPLRKTYQYDGKEITSWELGHVTHSNIRMLNGFYIGLAPLFLLLMAYLVYVYWFEYFEANFVNVIFLHLFMYVLVSNSIPSTQDVRVAFANRLGAVINIFLIASLFYFSEHLKGVFCEIQNLIYAVF